MIRIRDFSKRFDDKLVIDNFSYDFEPQRVHGLLGPSGCGKTTLLHLLAGLLSADSGTIEGLPPKPAAFVFQENRLLPWRTALENITVTGVTADRAAAYLSHVGLEGEENTYPDALSGGMARRLAIARAFAYGGNCFFLDEPLHGLDLKTKSLLLDFMKTSLGGKTAFLITHDSEEALSLADRLFVVSGPPLRVEQVFDAASLTETQLKEYITEDYSGERTSK